MLLAFSKRFEQYVSEGSKTHTIRSFRKQAVKVGEICHCYGDSRQKTMHLIGRWPCVKVEVVNIKFRDEERDKERDMSTYNARNYGIWIDGDELSLDECNALAWRDGFRDAGTKDAFDAMVSWWMNGHGLPFTGQIIHWGRL